MKTELPIRMIESDVRAKSRRIIDCSPSYR
jgi:hypothetical protein